MATVKPFLRSLVPVLLLGSGPQWACASGAPLTYRTQEITAGRVQYAVTVPEGYVLELLTGDLREPRLITFTENGDLFTGSRDDRVYRIPPPYTQPETLVELPGYPHSVAFRDGKILIARTNGVYQAPYAPGQTKVASRELTLLAALPGGRGHNSRTVRVGPDRRVYLSLGISGNCSDQYLDPSYPSTDRRGGILVLREDGTPAAWDVFASGLRNPVGFDWHPDTQVLYASNNGPDHLGFEQPPEYFTKVEAGSFHGMPWFQYDRHRIVRDPCNPRPPPRPLEEVVPPVATFPARNAPMGVAFVRKGDMHPALQGDAVVALRGSWGTAPGGSWLGDRATRRPPKVVVVRFEKEQAVGVSDLVSGFQLPDGERWARPVGVAIGPDGALYFTSDGGRVHGLFRLRRAH